MVDKRPTPQVDVEDWGRIEYEKAWKRQSVYHKGLIDQKRSGHSEGFNNTLVICEHAPVYTLGKSGSPEHLIWTEEQRASRGVTYFKINRGGDITYHGPGQLVVYPIFDLDQFFRDVHLYVRKLEEVIIRLLASYDIEAVRIADYTGVWIKGQPDRKVCAIGVHLSRWVSMHGLALNVSTDLSYFAGIVPCGINEENKVVTSMENELGEQPDLSEVKERTIRLFQEIFEFQIGKRHDIKA